MRNAFMIVALLAAACSSQPRVAPIQVRYLGVATYPPVPPEMVEVVRGPESRPSEKIASLEVGVDGSSFEELVLRLRDRAASIGADAIVDVGPMYNVPGPGYSQKSSNEVANTTLESARGVAGIGMSLFFSQPTFMGVRGTAVRLGGAPLDASLASTTPSPISEPERFDAPPPAPLPPTSKPAEEKP